MNTDLVIYKDRLSDFSDCVLLRILSNLKTKEAVQTYILSTRWKNLWKSLTIFSIGSRHFKTFKGFTRFVNRYLAIRDDETALHALKLYHDVLWNVAYSKRFSCPTIFRYICHLLYSTISTRNISCHTLTSLNLSVDNEIGLQIPIFSNSLKFPALTNLCLSYFYFRGTGDGPTLWAL
jgi:hypothetical protein